MRYFHAVPVLASYTFEMHFLCLLIQQSLFSLSILYMPACVPVISTAINCRFCTVTCIQYHFMVGADVFLCGILR